MHKQFMLRIRLDAGRISSRKSRASCKSGYYERLALRQSNEVCSTASTFLRPAVTVKGRILPEAWKEAASGAETSRPR